MDWTVVGLKSQEGEESAVGLTWGCILATLLASCVASGIHFIPYALVYSPLNWGQ